MDRTHPWYPTNGQWTTKDEIAFLQLLFRERKNRLSLLLEYQAAMRRRVNWGDMDKIEIEKEVRSLIHGALGPVRVAAGGRR